MLELAGLTDILTLTSDLNTLQNVGNLKESVLLVINMAVQTQQAVSSSWQQAKQLIFCHHLDISYPWMFYSYKKVLLAGQYNKCNTRSMSKIGNQSPF